MNGRAQQILGRFPAHFEPLRTGKRLEVLTEALARDIDAFNLALTRVRRARRLMEAEELRDLLQIGRVHGIRAAELAVLFTRLSVGQAQLGAAAASDAGALELLALWGLADGDSAAEKFPSRKSLVEFATRALANDALLDGARFRIRRICRNHARGNGTVRALVEGTANALDLDVLSVSHDPDRYLHIAHVTDRLRLSHPAAGGEEELSPSVEHILIEENPLTLVQGDGVGRKNGELFSVLRRGFDRTTLSIQFTGVEGRTVGPMLANRDEGKGIGYAGSVPSGTKLTFSEEGRVDLDGLDVTSYSYAWSGACFADAGSLRNADAVFDGPGVEPGRRARFATSTPEGALAASFVFPHAGDSLPMPSVAVGETRFAFFVQEGHFSRILPDPPHAIERVEPRPAVAFVDGSVFAAGASDALSTAAIVALSWHEHLAFWVNAWIPKRFRALTPEDPEGRVTLDAVALALNRFRPAGVHIDVKFLDDRWVLGRGVAVSEANEDDAVSGAGTGTELWPAPAETH